MRRFSLIILFLIMSACKENIYYCDKKEDKTYYLYTLKGYNDRLYEVSFDYIYSLDSNIKEEYISDFISFYKNKINNFQIIDNNLTFKKKYLIDGNYSILETIKQFQKDFYYCYKGK